ncbi:MAG TPA: dienelactone hydrolase family protein [Bdellovibrionota bacterium]|nr:dienelactone hydrolase family protein [Bdellovibrionota bacterium]
MKLHHEEVTIKTADGSCDAHFTHPADGAHPGVILYMDAFGVRPYLKEMADKLAGKGYAVLVPNLFYRSGHAPVLKLTYPVKAEDMIKYRPQIMELIQSLSPEAAMRDAGAYLDFLASHKTAVKGQKFGTTGYCMGGAFSLRTAARYPDRIAAAASFHAGRLVSDASDSLHLELGKIKAQVYVAHADNDQSMPPDQIAKFKEAVKKSSIHAEVELYEGAAHGFTMKDLPAYNAEALERHWAKLTAFFDRAFK